MKKIFILALFVAIVTSGCALIKKDGGTEEISLEEAKVQATDFINGYLMNPGQEVSIKEVVEENGLYKVVVNMTDGQEIDSYLTKDGDTFFPSAIIISDFMAENDQAAADDPSQASQPATLADIEKREKPSVELFVMSHCPYGTQIEKGILPVVDTLGDKMDFELKFVDYAMHDKKEIDEQLSQYCVQKNNPDKLNEYLYCFLEEGNGDDCLSQIGINTSQHNACISSTDEEFGVTAAYEDKSTYKGRFPFFPIYAAENAEYGVSGSPSLVINGKLVSSGRDSSSLLETICAGFDNPPAECNEELSAASPAPGFGFDGTGSATSASCE